MTYTIGEMSKMLNVSSSTIRYYDKEGLVAFCRTYRRRDTWFLKKKIMIFKDYTLSKGNRNANKRYS